MTRRWHIIAVGLAFLCLAARAYCQDANAQEPTYANPLLEQARTAQRKIAIAEIIKTLKITGDQAAVIYQVMGDLQTAQKQILSQIEQIVGANERLMLDYAKAALTDAPPAFDPALQQRIDTMVRQITAARGQYADFCRAKYDAVYATFTDEQRAAIETYQELALRKEQAAVKAAGGGASLDDLTSALLEVRNLSAPDYQQQAQQISERIAESLVGRDPNLLRPAQDAIVPLMEIARGLPKDLGQTERDSFRNRVAKDLQLDIGAKGGDGSDKPKEDLVTQGGFENLLRDPVTYQIIGDLLGVKPPAGADGTAAAKDGGAKKPAGEGDAK